MPWVLCHKCQGTRKVPVDPDDPDGEQEECPRCKDSGYPGHTYLEWLA